jgi:NAD(P)-dependent dehydrogenase (short-subunit alcohol dehydrogenase family)
MRLEPIEERVVVLVGASSGIGRKAAADCADMGARVAAAALDSLAVEIRARGGRATAVVADNRLTNPSRAGGNRRPSRLRRTDLG